MWLQYLKVPKGLSNLLVLVTYTTKPLADTVKTASAEAAAASVTSSAGSNESHRKKKGPGVAAAVVFRSCTSREESVSRGVRQAKASNERI